MNDPRCSTCGNPIGMSLKEAVARRDGIMPFVVQHEALKAKYQKWENDLTERATLVEANEARINQRKSELDQREESLASEKAAIAELLEEAEEALGKYIQAQQEISSLRKQIAAAADEHASYVKQTEARIESLRDEIEEERQKREDTVAGETDARAELAELLKSNRKTLKELEQAVARQLRAEWNAECHKNQKNSLKEQLRETKAQKATSERKAKSIESTNTKLIAKIQRLEEKIEKLQLTNPTASQRKLASDLAKLQAEHTEACKHLQSARKLVAAKTSVITDLRNGKAAGEKRCRSLETDMVGIRTENDKLTDANRNKAQTIKNLRSDLKATREKKQIAAPSFSLTDLDLLQELSREVSELFSPPKRVVTIGSGPFDVYEFDRYLETMKIDPSSDGSSWIIIGRDGWDEDELNELLDQADPDEVRVFSQELFIAGILTTHDPFSLPLEILMKFAEGHPALQYLIDQGFEWPEIVLEEDYGEPVNVIGRYGGVDESPLTLMGYHVGITRGLSAKDRRDLLKSAYQEEIPYVGDDDYMEEWGLPGRSKRLWRIAHHLKREADKRKPIWEMRYAVQHWAADSKWLKEKFYTRRMRFTWPDF